jgi:hypothetical protein
MLKKSSSFILARHCRLIGVHKRAAPYAARRELQRLNVRTRERVRLDLLSSRATIEQVFLNSLQNSFSTAC